MNNKTIKQLQLSVVFFWFAQYVYIPYQTPYLTGLQVSSSMIGLIVGAYGVSQMLLRLPVGILADKQDQHKLLIIIGGLSSGLASLFRVFVGGGTGFLIANLFSGLASATWISFMILYMSLYKDRQLATSSITMFNNLGMLLGFLCSTFLYDIVGMKVICLFSVISGLISSLIASRLSYQKQEPSPIKVTTLLKVCTKKTVIFFALLALIQQGVQMSTTMSFTSQIIRDLDSRSYMVGIGSIIYMLAAVFFSHIASSSYLKKLGNKVCITTIFLTTALYCMLVPNMTNVYIVLLLQILPGLATGIVFSYCIAESMQDVEDECRSTAMGFVQAVYALGMTVFPMICGKILNLYSMTYAYYFLMIICILGALATYIYYQKHS